MHLCVQLTSELLTWTSLTYETLSLLSSGTAVFSQYINKINIYKIKKYNNIKIKVLVCRPLHTLQLKTASGRARSGRDEYNLDRDCGWYDSFDKMDDHIALGKKALSAQRYKSTGWSLELKHSLQEFKLNFSSLKRKSIRGELERPRLSFLFWKR